MSGFGPLEEACERAGDQTEDQAQVHEGLKALSLAVFTHKYTYVVKI